MKHKKEYSLFIRSDDDAKLFYGKMESLREAVIHFQNFVEHYKDAIWGFENRYTVYIQLFETINYDSETLLFIAVKSYY